MQYCICLLVLLLPPLASQGQLTSVRQADSNTILCTFSLPQYTIVDTVLPREYGVRTTFKYVKMSDPDLGTYDSVGFPELPFLSYNFELPYSAYDCEIELSDIQFETVNIVGHILPNQIDTLWDDTVTRIPFSQNTSCYSSDHDFMSENCRLSETFIIRGVKGVRAIVLPFKYNPYRNQLKVMVSANIRIHYKRGRDISEYVASETWDNIYSSVFVNHVPNRQPPVAENYLIVTLPDYKNDIQYFADYKHSLGYNVTIISLEQNQQTPSEIMQVIQNLYDEPSTKPDYVLLVGDHPALPAYSGDDRCGDDQNKNDPITDVPYVFLEGDDYYRDALIGRWPVRSSNDVKTMANKTIYMEMNMHLFEKKVVLIAGYDDNPIEEQCFEAGLDSIRGGAFSTLGYNCSQLHQPDENTALWNLNNDPLYYIYSGHGSCYSCGNVGGTPTWYIDSIFIANSNHQTFPMTFAFACKTGNFACYSNSIAELWMRNKEGAVFYVGSSVKTFPVSDVRIGMKLFGDALRDEKTIGGMIAVGMKRFYDSFFTWPFRAKRYMKSYNLMGDPSFRIKGLGCANSYYVDQMKLPNGGVQYYRASGTVTFISDNVTADNGAELIVRAGNEIVFKDGFTASAGSEVSAAIEACIEQQRREDPIGEPFAEGANKSMLSSADNDSEHNINVYPNPTEGQVAVEIPQMTEGKVSIQIIDIFGRQVMECHEDAATSSYRKTIDASSLPSGCYYVVVTANESRNIKCIIKQ